MHNIPSLDKGRSPKGGRVSAIILASGSGSRFGGEIPKQFSIHNSRPVYRYSVDAFLSHPAVDSLVLVVHPDFLDEVKTAMTNTPKPVLIVVGGLTRQESAYRGLLAAESFSPDTVLIHDAARPYLPSDLIDRVMEARLDAEAVSPLIAVTDSLYQVTSSGAFARAVSRENLYRVQTPQGFDYGAILAAHKRAIEGGRLDFTDDVMLIDAYQLGNIVCVEGDPDNIKLTTPSDQRMIELILRRLE